MNTLVSLLGREKSRFLYRVARRNSTTMELAWNKAGGSVKDTMTNSQEQLGVRVSAELRDAGGDILSRGEALLFPDNSANFYPHDLALRETIQNHAKTLVLEGENQSRS